MVKKAKKALSTGRLPGRYLGYQGSRSTCDKTRMRREMQGQAYFVSLDERRVTRAVLTAPSVKICVFWTFFTIQVGAQKVIDFRRRDKRSFSQCRTEECTGFKMHQKLRLSFGHYMLEIDGGTVSQNLQIWVGFDTQLWIIFHFYFLFFWSEFPTPNSLFDVSDRHRTAATALPSKSEVFLISRINAFILPRNFHSCYHI